MQIPDWRLGRALRGAGLSTLRYDLVAGLTLAAIAVPEQMATARLGGFSPHIGFFAFAAGSVAFALFGSNRFLSAGADSTITPIFAGALALLAVAGSPAYAELAVALALMVGVLMILAGLFRAGWVADLLSIPVMTGFLAGVSIHIAISQAPALLGLPRGEGEVFRRVEALARHIGDANGATAAIGLATLATIVVGEKIGPRIPGALLALAAATFATRWFDLEHEGVAVVGHFDVAPPQFALPHVSLDELTHVLGLAFVIALVIMVQTAATSRSFPSAPGESPDVDRDFVGLGAGSLLAALLGAFPVNASPPRTAIVAETGGRSQLAGLIASGVVLLIAFYAAEHLAHVPEAALAGVLFFVAGRIFRVAEMRTIVEKTKAEFALVVGTMLLVTILPVQTGVGLAIMLSLIHGVYTTTRTRLIEFERIPGASIWWPEGRIRVGEKLRGVLVAGFQAPLSFLNANHFQRDLRAAAARGGAALKLVVLESSSIVEIDYTAARVLSETIDECRSKGVDFAISRLESVRAQEALENFGVARQLGAERFFHSVDEATRALAPDAEVERVFDPSSKG